MLKCQFNLAETKTKKADIVIYRSEKDKEKRENHYIIVECKEPDIKFPDGEKAAQKLHQCYYRSNWRLD